MSLILFLVISDALCSHRETPATLTAINDAIDTQADDDFSGSGIWKILEDLESKFTYETCLIKLRDEWFLKTL